MFLKRRGEGKTFLISDRLKKRGFLLRNFFVGSRMRNILFGTVIVLVLISTGVFGFNYFKHSRAANIPLSCSLNPATNINECLMQYDSGDNTIYLDDSNTQINNPSNPVNLTINGSSNSLTLTVVVSGTFYFRNLTINNAKITHDALIAGTDFDATTNVLVTNTTGNRGDRKKVDFRVSEQLRINGSYASINVTGKGYPGGKSSHPNGYGPSGGIAQNIKNAGVGVLSSGGGNYGDGGSSEDKGFCGLGADTKGFLSGGMASNSIYGSGSGYSFGNTCVGTGGKFPSATLGQAGGGFINIYANSFFIDDNSSVVADGNYISTGTNEVKASTKFAGGGAGGTIFLKYSYGNANYPSANRGGLCSIASYELCENYDDLNALNNAKNGLVTYSGQAGLFSSGGRKTNIHANGGGAYSLFPDKSYKLYAGPGGGGKVEVGIEGSLISVDKTYTYNSASLSESGSPINVAKGDSLKATLLVQNVEANKFVDIRDLIFQSASGGIGGVTNVHVYNETSGETEIQSPNFTWRTETISGNSYLTITLKAPDGCRKLKITYDATVT